MQKESLMSLKISLILHYLEHNTHLCFLKCVHIIGGVMFLSIVPTSDLHKGRHTFLIIHVTAVRMLVILSHQGINDIKMTSL
ncbi:unnamed protein product, partial [Gulo gulo]